MPDAHHAADADAANACVIAVIAIDAVAAVAKPPAATHAAYAVAAEPERVAVPAHTFGVPTVAADTVANAVEPAALHSQHAAAVIAPAQRRIVAKQRLA